VPPNVLRPSRHTRARSPLRRAWSERSFLPHTARTPIYLTVHHQYISPIILVRLALAVCLSARCCLVSRTTTLQCSRRVAALSPTTNHRMSVWSSKRCGAKLLTFEHLQESSSCSQTSWRGVHRSLGLHLSRQSPQRIIAPKERRPQLWEQAKRLKPAAITLTTSRIAQPCQSYMSMTFLYRLPL